ncbi:hypothetical protein AB0O75_05490 [Streptomyces sp. NPDC088921]|uniref:hypothetical protein n=1 Tax=unclassified Streptomyces TaxID=2593676 RepID=UPI0034352AA5
MTGFRPGGLGDRNGTDTPTAFAGSLAAAIDEKLHDLLTQDTGNEPYPMDDNSPDTRARRALFVAVAQAVLDHLRAHAAAGLTVKDVHGAPCTVTVKVESS